VIFLDYKGREENLKEIEFLKPLGEENFFGVLSAQTSWASKLRKVSFVAYIQSLDVPDFGKPGLAT